MSEQLEAFPDLTSGEKELWEFARWVITEGPFQGDDLDGGEIQKKAEELGLIRQIVDASPAWPELAEIWYEFSGPLAEKPT